MSFVAVAVGGGALIGAGAGIMGASMQSNAAQNAANTQANAAEYAANLQNQQFNTIQANDKPWLQAGQAALPQLSQMASQTPQFTQQDFLNNMDPGYAFDLQQGQQAIERSAAARGGLQSGGTLKSLDQYTQGLASNEYQNAYNRFMNNQNTQYNRLSSLAGLGQTANSELNQAGMTTAGNIGNTMMGAANAQGAAAIAQGNAWGGALGGLGSGLGGNLMQYGMMKGLMSNPTPSPMGSLGGVGPGTWAGSDGAGMGGLDTLAYT